MSEAVGGVGRRGVFVSGLVSRGASPAPVVAVGRCGGRGGTVPGRSGCARRGSVADAGGVSGKRAEAGGGGGLTVSAAKGEKGRRPGKRGRVSEEPAADAPTEPEPAPVPAPAPDPVPAPDPAPDPVPASDPVLASDPALAPAPDPSPVSEPAPESPPAPAPDSALDPLRPPAPSLAKPSLSKFSKFAKFSKPLLPKPLSSDAPRASGPLPGRTARASKSLPEEIEPASNPLPGVTARSAPEPFPRKSAPSSAPALRRAARLALPPSHHPVPDWSPPQVTLPLPLPADAPGPLCASCVPDTGGADGTGGIGPRPEPAPEAAPEDPPVPECGPSKSSPVVSFTGCVELPEGACGEVGCGGTGARRASVLMHPPFPRTRATVCFLCGPVFSCPCSYTHRRPPRLTRHAHKKTKSSRARIPAAADRHPGRGRTTGGVSSVRARHSTGCPRSNGNQSTPPGLLPGTSHYPAVILSGRLRS